MLQSLRIRNLAIVENTAVEFEPGLNVITGETGAGKSILVGALGLVLGARADKTAIRAGEDKCGVEAVFRLSDPSAVDGILNDLGLEACTDGALVLRRLISASGPGKILINDGPATAQALKAIGDLLVDMHGPHDHQSLLNQDFQLDLLDSFGHLWDPRAAYETLYREVSGMESSRVKLLDGGQDMARQMDLLAYQVREIENAAVSEEEEQELEREHSVVANAQRILELADAVRNVLTEDEASTFSALVSAQNSLAELADMLADAGAWHDEAKSIAVQVQELSDTINGAVQNVEADPQRLAWIEDRIGLLHRLKRKYGTSLKGILELLGKTKAQLSDLETREQRLAELDGLLDGKRREMGLAGAELGRKRRQAAGALAKAVTRELQGLGFTHGSFGAELSAAEPRPSGMDIVDFGFAPNVGEPMRPLRAIASSGEVSRVMLATKVVLADHDRIPVLVFDEIDANVGGEMGTAIGEKLAAVAKHRQVLCITHLPQVAVFGSTHLVVSKEVREQRTHTRVVSVKDEARAEEVARMLGGKHLTSVTLRHAREMLRNG